jgi:capsular exopolysaccharide synthesis family protein
MNLPAKIPVPSPVPYEYGPHSPEGFSLQALIATFQRRARIILLTGGAVALIVLTVLALQPRMYTATASIMINPREDRVVSPEQALTTGAPSSALVDSEIEVLRSPRLARAVAERLHLDIDPQWSPHIAGRQPLDRIRVAANQVSASLEVKRRALSYVIDVNVTASDRQEAARVANAVVSEYLRASEAARLAMTTQASNWLGERLAELRTDVQRKEAEAESFRASRGLLTAEGRSLTESELTQQQQAVLTAQADLAEREARYRQVQELANSSASGRVDTTNESLNSEVIRDLRRQEAELARQQAEYEGTLGARHPFVLNNRNELADIRRQIAAEVGRIAERSRNEMEVARSRLGTLRGTLGATSGQLANNNEDQVRLRELEREAAAARAVYESFLQRSHEIAGQGAMGDITARVVSDASPPRMPSSPRPLLGIVAALLAGLIAGALAGLGAEALDDSLKSTDEIEQDIGVPALAVVPKIPARAFRLLAPEDRHPAAYLVEKPLSPYAEAFRVLRTSVQYANLPRVTKVVAVTSPLPNEGKTSCALSLARVCALGGQRVVILDCDLRRRSLNRVLDIQPRAGLVEVLKGAKGWREVRGLDEPSGAHVIPLAENPLTPSDVFSLTAMEGLVDELREAYDLVIFDCAPVLVAADVRMVVANAEAVLMIAQWRKTRLYEAVDAVRQLQPSGVKILGVALNQFDPTAPGFKPYPPYYARAYYEMAA